MNTGLAIIFSLLVGFGTGSICLGIAAFILLMNLGDYGDYLRIIARNITKQTEELEKIRKNSEPK